MTKKQKPLEFNHRLIQGENILETTHLNDLGVGRLYEIITKILPCEVAGMEYSKDLFDYILKHHGDFELVTHYCWNKNTSRYMKIMGDCFSDILDTINDYQVFNYFFYSLHLDLVIGLRFQEGYIELSVASAYLSKIESFIESIEKFKHIKVENKIGIINTSESGSLNIKEVKIPEVNIDVELNYGQEFLKKHRVIKDKLSNSKSGLYIFNGPPSGGKTHYIKYLSQQIKSRTFIYVPVSLVDSITSPSLISLLLRYPDSVLILEDAEKAIVSREESSNPDFVSTLLNLSDGILSDVLGLSLIVTFNTERSKCDPALLRKGRLFAEHYFGALTIEESNKLATHLNKNVKFDKPMMLGEIYNLEQDNFHKEEEAPVLGFR